MAARTSLARLAVSDRETPTGGVRYDWLMIAVLVWLLIGAYLDSWAHGHVPNLETFFTPWHGVLYSGYFAVAGLLGATLGRNHRLGFPWLRSLPGLRAQRLRSRGSTAANIASPYSNRGIRSTVSNV
jgi:hypothetical protein